MPMYILAIIKSYTLHTEIIPGLRNTHTGKKDIPTKDSQNFYALYETLKVTGKMPSESESTSNLY